MSLPDSIIISPGAVDDPLRNEIFRGMQLSCAGQPAGSVLAAHIDSLAVCIVMLAKNAENAQEIFAATGRDLAAAIDRNWELVKGQLASASPETGTA